MAFEIARRHRFAREMAEVQELHPDVEVHVLPTAGTSARDDSILAYRDFSRVGDRSRRRTPPRWPTSTGQATRPHDGTPAAAPDRGRARRHGADHAGLGDRCRSGCSAPPPLSPRCRAAAGAAAALAADRLPHRRVAAAGDPVRLWLASGFGRRIRTPYWEGPLRLLTARCRVFFWQARWALQPAIDIAGTDPDTHAGPAGLVVCRHAGPGDSFMLIHALVNWLRPRAADRAQGHAAVGPGGRRAAQPAPGRFIAPDPAAGEDLESRSPRWPSVSTTTTRS